MSIGGCLIVFLLFQSLSVSLPIDCLPALLPFNHPLNFQICNVLVRYSGHTAPYIQLLQFMYVLYTTHDKFWTPLRTRTNTSRITSSVLSSVSHKLPVQVPYMYVTHLGANFEPHL